MNLSHLVHVVSMVLGAVAIALGLSTMVALGYGDGDFAALLAATLVTVALGAVGYLTTGLRRDLSIREGYAVVAFAWITVGVVGALPYLFAGVVETPVHALFESVSGFTTTGATVFAEIEALPRGILFWRSLTQWIGGMGIIVLGIAILPFLGVGGMQLFRAEVPGPTPERLQPRIAHTAKLLWYVYAGLTAALVGLYLAGGMSLYDATTHAFTTLSTGGFSPRNASMAAFDSAFIQYITVVFMFAAAVNFTLHYRAFTNRGRGYLGDADLRFFACVIGLATLAVATMVLVDGGHLEVGLERVFRNALFQVTSIGTTTGYVTFDYALWPLAAQLVLVGLMLIGGMAGSTSGSAKTIRIHILMRHGLAELKKAVHPRAVIVTRIGRTPIREDVILKVLTFLLLFFTIFAAGIVVLAMLGHDLSTAVGASASAIGNIGPGLGAVGAVEHYGWMGPASHWVLIVLMLMGRLEIFTILLLFHPDLWRNARWK